MAPNWQSKGTRVVVIDGPYAGKVGHLVRPDGTANGKQAWLVKLDHAFFGATVQVAHMRPTKDN